MCTYRNSEGTLDILKAQIKTHLHGSALPRPAKHVDRTLRLPPILNPEAYRGIVRVRIGYPIRII